MLVISGRHRDISLRDHAVLIWGAVGATLLGALTALQLDLFIAVGSRLMHPVGQEALIRTTAAAGLTGLLCWVICALVTRAISRNTIRPYNALADHFERLADGYADRPVDLRGPVPVAHRLSRAVVVFQERALVCQGALAALQARYDRLEHDHAQERLLQMSILMSRRPGPDRSTCSPRSPAGIGDTAFDPTTPIGRYDSLYQDARERRLLVDMLMVRRANPEGAAADLQPPFGVPLAEFAIPVRPAERAQFACVSPTHVAPIIDPTGCLTFPAQRAERNQEVRSDRPDLTPIDFTFSRR